MNRWLVNGVPGALVQPMDRGLLYGDGLFETIAFHGGRSALWPLHMARLAEGCRRLGLPPPDRELLAEECRALLAGAARAVVRLGITRGSGGRAYFPPERPEPTRIVIRREFPADIDAQRARGIVMRTSPIALAAAPPARDHLGGIKHSSRLEQVLIAADCMEHAADEALVLDAEGMIVEGLAGNIVVIRDGEMIAPGPHPAAVAGVGLEWLRRAAGPALSERPVAAAQLQEDDSLWVINSVRGPCRVRTLDGRELGLDSRLAEWQRRWFEEIEK